MLTERFSMIAKNQENGVGIQAAALQPLEQLTERRITIVQCIQILSLLAAVAKRSWLWCAVRMVAGDGQIGEQEFVPGWKRINPFQHPFYCSRFIHTEAGIEIATDGARILQNFVASVLNHGVHAQIHEPARMKKCGTVAGS